MHWFLNHDSFDVWWKGTWSLQDIQQKIIAQGSDQNRRFKIMGIEIAWDWNGRRHDGILQYRSVEYTYMFD